ncbi:unnamed protein product [Prunus armeniaca]
MSTSQSVTLDTTQLLADYLFELEDPVKAVKMSRKGFMEQDLSKLDVTKLHPLLPEVISCKATINIDTIGHVAHGKSAVVKAISGVQVISSFHLAFDAACSFSFFFFLSAWSFDNQESICFQFTRV